MLKLYNISLRLFLNKEGDKMFLGKISHKKATEYFKHSSIALIPVGATENHGSHLALGTDYYVPTRLAEMIEKRTDILVTPPIPYGVSDHHSGFDGTISIGYEGLYITVNAIVQSLYKSGIRRFVFLNGHGGNNPVLSRISLELNQKGDAAAATLNWWSLAGQLNPSWKGGHGGGQETAAMLAIDPTTVDMSSIQDFVTGNLNPKLPHVSIGAVSFQGAVIDMARDVQAVTCAGWFGPDHPSTASVKWGNEMLEAVCDFSVKFIDTFRE